MRLKINWIPIALVITLLGCLSLQSIPVWGAGDTQAPASVENMAFPLPDKPSFAILAFENLSGDPDLEYLSDGFAVTLINALCKVPSVFVIGRNSAFAYKGKSVPFKEIAEDLGVQYLIEGSVEKSGNQLGIAVRMIDVLKGNDVWSERYDRKIEDIFKTQNEILLNIVKTAGAKCQDKSEITQKRHLM